MPEFLGGMSALMEFIRKNLRHDKAEKRERVIIQIVVDKKGNATNPVVLRSTNPALDEEALRIVSLMPKWKVTILFSALTRMFPKPTFAP